VLTPAGSISIFGFQTAIPYPFGAERNGYLVTDMAAGIRAAKASGADLVVAPFPDQIGPSRRTRSDELRGKRFRWRLDPQAFIGCACHQQGRRRGEFVV